MHFPVLEPRRLFRRSTLKNDAMSGLVLGVESVPDGLASGLLYEGTAFLGETVRRAEHEARDWIAARDNGTT